MAAGRFLVRTVGGLAALGVAALVIIPVGMVMLAVAAVVGVVAMLSVGIPAFVIAILALIAILATLTLIGGAFALSVLALKVLLFGMLVAWLSRRLFGWRDPRPATVLVGAPIADVPAPGPQRDAYEIAAERELDEELGFH